MKKNKTVTERKSPHVAYGCLHFMSIQYTCMLVLILPASFSLCSLLKL